MEWTYTTDTAELTKKLGTWTSPKGYTVRETSRNVWVTTIKGLEHTASHPIDLMVKCKADFDGGK